MEENPAILDDLVQPFQLESGPLRGRLVRLGPALDLILYQHAYPPAVGALLGEAIVIASALGTTLKYEGVFTLQAKSDGPVRLLVADVTSDGGIRAYAQHHGIDGIGAGVPLLGKGYLAFTVDQQVKDDRYQGIVQLESENLAEAVQHYFRQSEQLPTGIIAAAKRDAQGRWRGGCLILQQMPWAIGGERGARITDTSSEDNWQRAMMLMGTCGANELTDPNLSPNELLFRLFHEEGVRVYEPHTFRHQCRCSEVRVTEMLKALPRAEVETLAIDGIVSVTCEFCNKSYRFDEAQRAVLYSKDV
jgi:molecular chaperone Hsp33